MADPSDPTTSGFFKYLRGEPGVRRRLARATAAEIAQFANYLGYDQVTEASIQNAIDEHTSKAHDAYVDTTESLAKPWGG